MGPVAPGAPYLYACRNHRGNTVRIRAFIRDLKGKPAVHAGLAGPDNRHVRVIVEGETITLTASEWNGLLVWGGALPDGLSSRYP
jgi:hypothetical protein